MDRTTSSRSSSSKEVRNQESELTSKDIRPSKGTRLHHYARQGNEDMVQFFVDNGIFNLNAKDSNGNTALMLAVKKKNRRITEILLSAGSDITIENYKNKSALTMVCAKDYFTPELGKLFFQALCRQFPTREERATHLKKAGCVINQALIFFGADMIDYMAVNGFSIHLKDRTTQRSPLHLATIKGDIDCVKVLLNHNADASAKDYLGLNPLAYIYGFSSEHTSAKVELLKILLSQEVSPTSCTSSGLFQIGATLSHGSREAIHVVLQSKLDFSAKDEVEGKTVLHYIAFNLNPGVANELKLHIHKFDLTLVDNSNSSPLHIALERENTDMIKIFLQHGITSTGRHNQFCYPPLYHAYAKLRPSLESKFDQCIEMLLENGADPQCVTENVEKNEQQTVFHAAKRTNSLCRMKPVIAQLAIVQGLGVPIKQIISAGINLNPELGTYFKSCQKMIKSNVFGTITILKLLSSNKKVLAQYSNNKELMLKLKRLRYKQEFKEFYPYYYNILRKRLSNGIQHRIFLDRTTKVLRKVCKNHFDGIPLIINKIIDYLDEESIEKLQYL